ncbi:MAG TPA: MCP four helix bundle domain-containing protein, partial [Xanthobacteraceae bacterium]|nr:MCP four helix bundle domain-containing protein [Xanthobacteraceae bacterium]
MSERAFRFRDISVRKKIAATLGVLVFIICGTGLFSADRLMRVHQTTVEINSNWLPSIRYIDEIRYNMARHRAIISRHVMTSELEKKRSIESRLLLVEKKIEERRKLYEPLIASATERAQYDALVSAWQAYLASCARMLAISTQGDNAEGAKLFLGEVSSGGLKAETTIDKIVETNLAGADAAEQAGAALYTSSRDLLIALGGLAVLFALASGYVLTRGVALPVNAMTAAMTRLAGGDLDIPIPASGQHDEIGKMAAAVQVFKDNMIE